MKSTLEILFMSSINVTIESNTGTATSRRRVAMAKFSGALRSGEVSETDRSLVAELSRILNRRVELNRIFLMFLLFVFLIFHLYK